MVIFNFIPVTRRFITGLITLVANIIWGRIFNQKIPRGPLFVTWLLTFDCNAFCTFCGTHMLKNKYPETMKLERALEIADEIADSGTWVVGFTGGEVFLNPLLFPLIKHLKERGLVVYLVTNGFDLKSNAEKLVNLAIDLIVVSIDYDNAYQHDEIRKVSGLYVAAIEGIEEVKRLRGQKGPIVRINTILMRENIEQFDSILSNLLAIADDVSVQPISMGYENNPHCRSDERINRHLFSNLGEQQLSNLLRKNFVSNKHYKDSYNQDFYNYWIDPQSLIKTVSCWAPYLRLVIQPTGEVLHCCANKRFGSIGNVGEESIMQVWNSAMIRQDREIIACKNNNCICWTRDTAFNSKARDLKLPNLLPYLGKKYSNNTNSGESSNTSE